MVPEQLAQQSGRAAQLADALLRSRGDDGCGHDGQFYQLGGCHTGAVSCTNGSRTGAAGTVAPMTPVDLGLFVLRVVFGLFFAYHGYNKVFGGNGLSGTAAWFSGIGMKWPAVQARLAAGTEIGAGLLLAAGLLTPLAAAGVIGVMIVAIVVAHWKVGFFVFLPNQGWEYCASIAVAAWVIATVGPGDWSLDHVLGIAGEPGRWAGAIVAGVVGIGAALLQLAVCYRPERS